MKNCLRFRFVAVAGLVGFLTACGGGGGGSSSSEVVQAEDAAINDAFINEQWYLNNIGQSALTSSGLGGVTGEDIRAFSSTFLSPENYAKGYKGTGVEIAIVDTGLEIRHEDLAENVVAEGSYNFINGSNDPTNTVTNGDHGTSVAGLAAGRGGNDIGIWGVAPRAMLRGFNLIASNQDLSQELASLGYQEAVDGFLGLENVTVSVFNKSYGTNPVVVPRLDDSYPSSAGAQVGAVMDAMEWGTEHLRNGKGAIYIKAGGNEYHEMPKESNLASGWCSIANEYEVTCYNLNQETENNSPYQIVVGAFNAAGVRSSYSNTGSAIWLSAPGGEYGFDAPALMTTDQSGCDAGYSQTFVASTSFNRGATGSGNELCNYYSSFNGTSSATPIVSGVVALLLEANSDLTWRDVKHILAATARQIDPSLEANNLSLGNVQIVVEQGWVENAAGYHFSNAYGFGAVNVREAMQMALDWKSVQTHLPDMVIETLPNQTLDSENTIPSGSPLGLVKKQNVTSSMIVESIQLRLNISATSYGAYPNIDPSDYLIELTSPSGTRSILLTPFNAYQSGHDMEGILLTSNAFYGELANGEWTLKVIDMDNGTNNRIYHGGEGQLDDFQFTLYGH
ncbi:S8 family serine peptidase [Thiomicrospira sp. XS5]|uniref:S8 family serine peptidase n=1 Tax=Thiomicrospira sp. XS5 TaxID=1775636 RepID=UPI000837CFCB|nr:S8 family serine peptidase [Thiomicrospira sp. XS5]